MTVENTEKYPFYGQATINNGIISYESLIEDVLNNKKGLPTILVHSNNQNVVYVESPFYLKDGHGATSVLQSIKLNKTNALFLMAAISSVITKAFSYNCKATKIALKNSIIQLPLKENALAFSNPCDNVKNIDFDFMESFIRELEEERIRELNAYLLATGLKDYTLTPEEENALEAFKTVQWGEFKLGDLFDILTSKKRFDANKVELVENCGHPYVVRTSSGNGQKGFIDEDEIYLNDGNTISFGQDTATMYYQEVPYFTGDKIKILKSKLSRFGKTNAQFFLATMRNSFQNFTWGSSSFNVSIIANQKIQLPLTKNNEIDYATMETFIKAVEKLVIKDVVLYADSKIKATKEVVSPKQTEYKMNPDAGLLKVAESKN